MDKFEYADKIITCPQNIKRHMLGRNGIMYTPTVMAKKDVLEKAGGFDEKMKRGVDGDFYRTCIVRYGYNVLFMEDVTTAVHEYGDDRITPQDSIISLKKTITANLYLIKKYNIYYLIYISALALRVKTIVSALSRILVLKIK